MKILISNDDGIFAPGIEALVKAFAHAGHEVTVCAPDSQRSAASHSLSINRPITVKETTFDGAVRAFAIGGTPADCVKLGLMRLCPDCEAVVSGINCGYNAGSDILYSGTVAAAMEGAICGRPALAVSQPYDRKDYTPAAQLAVRVFAQMMERGMEPGSMLNLNYPGCDTPKGLVRAEMGQLHYNEIYTPSVTAQGDTAYTLNGVIEQGHTQSDDYAKLCEGYATWTMLYTDLSKGGASSWADMQL